MINLDRHGYPTEEFLDRIRAFEIRPKHARQDCDEILSEIGIAFEESGYGMVKGRYWGRGKRLVTGGWSGNEDMIEAMRENYFLWSLCWQQSNRGGSFLFKLPEVSR